MNDKKIETPEEKRDRELVEVVAFNISHLSRQVVSLLNGPLNRKALIILLAHSSGQSQTVVSKILEALENLEKDWINASPEKLEKIRGDKG